MSRRALLVFLAFVAFIPVIGAEKKVPAIHVVLAGDSTVTDDAGWGKAFRKMLTDDAKCTNTAHGGESTKSFVDRGAWTKALELKPNYILIQFGHNDMAGKGANRETDPATTYRANLIRFVDEARAAGVQPILVTSIPRRNFTKEGKLVGELAPYVAAMRKVAEEKKVPLADLYARSVEEIEKLGPAKSDLLGPWSAQGKPDRTHLNSDGARFTANLLAGELRKVAPELAKFIRADPPR